MARQEIRRCCASQARRFGETLVERHVLSRDDLEHALDEAQQQQTPLAAVLLRRGLVGEQGPDRRARRDTWACGSSTSSRRRSTRTRRRSSPPKSARQHAALARRLRRTASSSSRSPSRPTTTRVAGDRRRDRLRDHPGRRRPRRARPRDRHDLRRRADDSAAADRRQPSSVGQQSPRPRTTSCTSTTCSSSCSQYGGSDLHLTAGSPPIVRVHGDLHPMSHLPTLNGSQIRQMVYSIISQKQREKFENELELDTSYALPGKGRFRVNVFLQRDSVGCVHARDPVRDRRLRRARRAAVGQDAGRTCRVGSCSSPARPVRGSRRRSRRSSTS